MVYILVTAQGENLTEDLNGMPDVKKKCVESRG
jgi:hypothetical protein